MKRYVVNTWAVFFGLLVAAAIGIILFRNIQLPGMAAGSAPGRTSDSSGKALAPEFPAGLEWLNTDRPLRLRDLHGKVVLLDFWTYCCINCIHVIPDLKRLEKKYPDALVVIGVHSAKFTTERDTENIRQAILRYEIEHPVINDRNMIVWRQYGTRAWPTLVLIDPAGRIDKRHSGEGAYDVFDARIAELIARFDANGQMDRTPLRLKLERQSRPPSLLSFPGKVLADETSNQLFIADSNQNRIVVVSLDDAAVKDVVGTGAVGMHDGDFDEATFNHPQGMAFDGRYLYVADTENHAIRRVDFQDRTVTTIAGTGSQARGAMRGGPRRKTALNSPWALVAHDGFLYIAMAGPHQLWRMDLAAGEITRHAGSGREGRIDGPNSRAALAQPSGLATDGNRLYFADSEVSAIRSSDIDPNGRVDTIVGGDLFDFGDRDARGLAARLQHPLGVAYRDGALYVADTYNNKIKRVSLKDRMSRTFLGTGETGLRDGLRATFDEPAGLSIAHGKLYIADTNNHSIRVADLRTKRVETLRLRDVEKLRPVVSETAFEDTIQLSSQTIGSGETTLTLSVQLPPGYKLTAGAPSQVSVTASKSDVLTFPEAARRKIGDSADPIHIPLTATAGQATVQVDAVVYYCEAGKESLCYFREVRLILPVTVQQQAGGTGLSIRYAMPSP